MDHCMPSPTWDQRWAERNAVLERGLDSMVAAGWIKAWEMERDAAKKGKGPQLTWWVTLPGEWPSAFGLARSEVEFLLALFASQTVASATV